MAHKRILTKKQQETLNAISGYIKENKKSPTVSELAGMLDIGSYQTVVDRINALRRRGLIRKMPYKWRGIELVEDQGLSGQLEQVPLVASVGADNLNVFAQEEYDQHIRIENKFLKGYRDVIAIRVIGNSMRDAGMKSGDIILVEDDETQIKNGDSVVAIVGDMAVVKQIKITQDIVVLYPKNKDPQYEPIIISKDRDDFRLIGRVIDVLPLPREDEDDDVQIEEITEQ